MNEKEYLELRVEDQIAWYEKKSKANKNAYIYMQIIIIITAATIPILNLIPYLIPTYVKLVVSILGGLIIILTGLISLYKFNDKWIEYRTTCEGLKMEKMRFLTKSFPYLDEQDAFKLFVNRIENQLSAENAQWNEIVKRKEAILKK